MSTNQAATASNIVAEKTGLKIEVTTPNDPIEAEYQRLLAEDDKAQIEIDQWINNNVEFNAKGAGSPKELITLRIEQRREEVKKKYQDFLQRHPKHAKARIAYGSFLNETAKDESAAQIEWEKARELAPTEPAVWNNLGNFYGHNGNPKKAIEYYLKAVELNPREPVYYGNLAVTVYLFRQDAMEYFKITEQQVFDKTLDYYKKALALDPTNFVLATDYAQTYYGIKPSRWQEALGVWQEVIKLAGDDIEREGIRIHLARCYIGLGQYEKARAELAQIKQGMYDTLKKRVTRNLEEREKEAAAITPNSGN